MQTMGIDEMGIGHAKFLDLGIHHVSKALHRAANMLSQKDGYVIG